MGKKTKKRTKHFSRKQKKFNLKREVRGKKKLSIKGGKGRKKKVEDGESDDEDMSPVDFAESSSSTQVDGGFADKSAKLSVDEFLQGGWSSASEEEEEVVEESQGSEQEVRTKNASMRDEIAQHRQELEELKKTDPEFYEHLKANAGELLEFGDDISEDDAEIEHTSDASTRQRAHQFTEEEVRTIPEALRLDEKRLKSNVKLAFKQHNMQALKFLTRAFKDACNANVEKPEEETIQCVNRTVYGDLMKCMFTHIPQELQWRFMHDEKGKRGKFPKNLTKHPSYDSLKPIITTFSFSALHFLKTVKDNPMIRYLLSKLKEMVQFIRPFNKVVTRYTQALLGLWGSGHPHVRVDAFLVIFEMAKSYSGSFIDKLLKQMYLKYVRSTRAVNERTLPTITFMTNCLSEIYGLDPMKSYQHGFVYIRQLAIHLRNAILAQTKGTTRIGKKKVDPKTAYLAVYNWQYINCLRAWTKVLCDHGSKGSELYDLVYPLVQVMTGVIQLRPGAQHYPLRFQCVTFLNELANSTQLFIPIAPYLIEVFQCAQFSKKNKKSKQAPPNWETDLKIPTNYLQTQVFVDSLLTEALKLVVDYFTIYSYSIAFPEIVFPACVFLRRFNKKTKSQAYQKQVKKVVRLLEANSQWIVQKRQNVDFSPRDVDKINNFLTEDRNEKKSPLDKHRPTESSPSEVLNQPNSKKKKKKKKKKKRNDKQDKLAKNPKGRAQPAGDEMVLDSADEEKAMEDFNLGYDTEEES